MISFGNLEMSLFLVGPGRTTLPIAILQYLEWKIDPTVAAVSVIQIALIGAAMLVTDRYVKICSGGLICDYGAARARPTCPKRYGDHAAVDERDPRRRRRRVPGPARAVRLRQDDDACA